MLSLLRCVIAPTKYRCFIKVCFVALLVMCCMSASSAQSGGGVDLTGTGGSNTIQGRLYFPSGRRADSRVKVKLESLNYGELSVLADSNGSFSFKSLGPGSYTVVVEADENYERASESVYIDGPSRIGRSAGASTLPRTMTVHLHLQPKRGLSSRVKADVIDASLADVPKPAVENYQKALEAAQAGDGKNAVEYLKKAVAIFPTFALALNELGVQYLKLGQADKAAETLRTVIKVNPEAFTSRLNYGIALLEKKAFTEAEKELRQALTRNHSSPTAHMYLGVTLINLRKYDEAEKELQRALVLSKEQLRLAHYYMGGIYWRKKEYKLAADALEKYLKLSPQAPDAERVRTTVEELRRKQ